MVDPCRFEPDIVLLKRDLPKLESNLKQEINLNKDIVIDQHVQTQKTIKNLVDLIKGTDTSNPGLLTQVILNQKSITRLWWFNSMIGAAFLAMLGKLVFF